MFMKGHMMSQETRDKIGRAGRLRTMSQESRDKISQTLLGHTHSEETRNKIAATLDKTGDLTNKKFGLWLALEKRSSRNNVRYWFCRCDCGIEKEVSQRNLINGRSSGCIKCSGKKNTLRATERNAPVNGRYEWVRGNPRANWWKAVRKAQVEKQKGICSICLKPLLPENQHFDHDHETNLCREIVHGGCNVFIGFVENNPGILDRVKDYIEKYKIGEGRNYVAA
jgi:hypothetical protein